jgi:hypothetical protein
MEVSQQRSMQGLGGRAEGLVARCSADLQAVVVDPWLRRSRAVSLQYTA